MLLTWLCCWRCAEYEDLDRKHCALSQPRWQQNGVGALLGTQRDAPRTAFARARSEWKITLSRPYFPRPFPLVSTVSGRLGRPHGGRQRTEANEDEARATTHRQGLHATCGVRRGLSRGETIAAQRFPVAGEANGAEAGVVLAFELQSCPMMVRRSTQLQTRQPGMYPHPS